MNIKKFSIVEMIIVLAIICILLAIAFPYMRDAQVKQRKVTTRNMLNQEKAMISAYYTDYGLLPLSMQVNPNTYSDTTAIEYWKRLPRGTFSVNPVPAGTINNSELRFDLYDNEGGSDKVAFDAKYPTPASKLLTIPLEPWYIGVSNKSKIEAEELTVVAHSSRFLNYYLSGSGFDLMKDSSYVKNESKWLGDFDTAFRLSYERSAIVRPFLYFLVDETITWNGASPEIKQTTIPPYVSYVFDKSLIYFDYIPKIIGAFNAQTYSKNLAEDKKRRIYNFHEDKNPDGTVKALPLLIDKYASKKVTLGSDRVMFNGNFFGSTSLRDARTQKDAATAATAAAAAQLAAAVTPAQIAAANTAVANAITANTAADKAMHDATPGDLNNSNSTVYMRAHTDNVKCIVDAFNTPIVYITYTNQRRESARTYSYVDATTGVPDPTKDKAMRAESYIIYSLGQNKADDSDLGESYMNKLKTGDDIIEMAGEK